MYRSPTAALRVILAVVLWLTAVSAGGGENHYSIQVFFKLDPRLLGSTYGGERWVSPATFGPVQRRGNTIEVEARARVFDARGRAVRIVPEWKPDDVEMVTVTPRQANVVTISVRRAGETRLQVVTAHGGSRTLSIKGEQVAPEVLKVQITQ